MSNQDQVNFFYFDDNRRVYELNGVRRNSPYYEGYFVPLKTVSETDKEIICEYGVIKKKTMQYHTGRSKFKVYTEQEKDDLIYVQENRRLIADKVLALPADKLRVIESFLGLHSHTISHDSIQIFQTNNGRSKN